MKVVYIYIFEVFFFLIGNAVREEENGMDWESIMETYKLLYVE